MSTLELNGLDAIPDTFGPVPLCEKQQSASSGITIFTKMPRTSGASPYCYSAEPFIEQSSTQCVSAECKKVLASLGGSSKPSQVQTLCRTDESTALGFKIAQKNKFVSLCEGANNRYLVYRYGTAGKIELQYPEQPDASS